MMLHRKRFLASLTSACASAGLLRFPAGAAEYTYKWAAESPADYPIPIRMTAAADAIFKESGGRLQIRVFPNAILGSTSSQLTQVREGAIEMSGLPYITAEPAGATAVGLVGLPFAFLDHKMAYDAMDGPFGRAMRNTLATKLSLHVFGTTWDAEFREVSNNVRPIQTPTDMKGLKLRISATPVLSAAFRALGSSPVSIPGGPELYTAAQTKLVDGMDMPFGVFKVLKIYEVQRYLSIYNMSWVGYEMVANLDAWRRLPSKIQDIVERNVTSAAAAERADIVKLGTTLEADLRGRGMVVNDADIPSFKAALRSAGMYKQWRDYYGADASALLEKSVGVFT